MKLVIRVTANDIKQGCRAKGDNCPIARAIMRRMKKPFGVNVGSSLRFGVWNQAFSDPMFTVEHSQRTRDFVANFDSYSALANANAKPFEFLLDVPNKWAFMFKRI